MTVRTDYFRNALNRVEENRVFLSKVSVIPFSNDKNRMQKIHSARELQSHIQLKLAKLAIAKPKSWVTDAATLDQDFSVLEETLEKLWANPLNHHYRGSAQINHNSGN